MGKSSILQEAYVFLLFSGALSFIASASPSSAEKLPEQYGGLKGYISMNVSKPPPDFRYGVSFYSSVWPLLKTPLDSFQIGLPATWIIPDNTDFKEPLCPPGTFARDNWPERGPYYRDVFQTIEGGLGFWASTQFGSPTPKYRINGTPDGYNHQISSPGFGFGDPNPLPANIMGIAQLSNRILLPPDGFTFKKGANGEVLGNAWMALPLMSGDVPSQNPPTGDQCWTLFFNAANFKGPVAFWIPRIWSMLSAGYPVIDGRGLDARPAIMAGGAMEFNTVPYFQNHDDAGNTYARIPEILFPVDKSGRTTLMEDVRMYSKEALWDSVQSMMEGKIKPTGKFNSFYSWSPALTANRINFRQGSENLPIHGIGDIVQTEVFGKPSSRTFGLEWKTPGSTGIFPEYYKQVGEEMEVIPANQVPESAQLQSQQFQPSGKGKSYECPGDSTSVWWTPGPKRGPYHAKLTDGSVVTYYWYRFVDQPSLQHLHLNEKQKEDLQARFERIQSAWKTNTDYIPPLAHGKLVSIDPALIVKPPKGLEIGYVPIVAQQTQK